MSSEIESCKIVNASGCMCDTNKVLNTLYESEVDGICTKTSTWKCRSGNPSPRYWENPDGSFTINSMGLPNLGIEYYLDFFRSKGNPDPNTKHRCLSLAVMSLDETVAMLSYIYNNGKLYYEYLDAIEWNLSCPNLVGKGILAYDMSAMGVWLDGILPYITKFALIKPLEHGLKLPPYFEPYMFDTVSELIIKYPFIKFINTVNSVPNGLVIDLDTESTVIHPKSGYGGLGGTIIKPVALANIYGFYTAFKNKNANVYIIGTGGITNGADVFEFVLAGATMVAVGSQLMMEGIQVFERLHCEFRELMIKKGYTRLDEFRGKLKIRDPIDDS